jgi:hypothetical protein
MRVLHDPLFALAAALGIEPHELSNVETPTRLAGTFVVAGTSVAAAVTSQAIDALSMEYGDAVTITFRTGALDEFAYDGSYSVEALAQFVSRAAQSPQYDLLLEVEKSRLVRRVLDGEPPCEAVLYFTAEAAIAAFRSGIRAIEKALWPDTSRRLLILVLDREVLLRGDSLSVVGGAQLDEAPNEAARPPADLTIAARAAIRRDEYIGWDTEFVTTLTPWHFYFGTTDASELVPYLDAAFVLLAALFTCDRARAIAAPGSRPTIRAEFRGREHVAFVPIIQGDPLTDVSIEQRQAVIGLIEWCYQRQSDEGDSPDWLADRLPFVQTRVAQALEGRPEDARFRAIATSMPEILQGAKWQWRAFVEGRVSEYLDKVSQLEGMVADTVDHYAERTTALSRGLADTMLAAVAALIGSFIAGAFAQPFDTILFRIGLLTYAGYVFVFPGALGLLSGQGQVAETKASFEAQRTRFNHALYEEKVDEIVSGRVLNAESRYRRWLCGVAAGYLLLTLAAAAAAVVIPQHVGSPGISTTTTTTTITTTPSGR